MRGPATGCVRLAVDADGLTVEITDDGVGHRRRRRRAGVGLSSMRERAAELGGSLRVDGGPGRRHAGARPAAAGGRELSGRRSAS